MDSKAPFYKSHTFAIWVTGVGAIVVILATWLWPADPNHPYGPQFLSFLGRTGRLLLTPVVGVFCATIGYIFGKRASPPDANVGHAKPAARPVTAHASPPLSPTPTSSPSTEELAIDTDHGLRVRIFTNESQGIKAVVLRVDNQRLDAIEGVDTIIYSAHSFDGNLNEFRTYPAGAGVRITLNDVVPPSEPSRPAWLLRKYPTQPHLQMGDSAASLIKWPANDTSLHQRWRLSMSVGAKTHAHNSSQTSTPLPLIKFDLILYWDITSNQFSLESV